MVFLQLVPNVLFFLKYVNMKKMAVQFFDILFATLKLSTITENFFRIFTRGYLGYV